MAGHAPIGYIVTGKVLKQKGTCDCEHKVGDTFVLSTTSPGGLCGVFYHDLYPWIAMYQFGGKFPDEWGGTVRVFECMDVGNTLTLEMRREGLWTDEEAKKRLAEEGYDFE
jgi:uncharacterized repeat protein (TIGR04076 family)